jgi:hypothetical protein
MRHRHHGRRRPKRFAVRWLRWVQMQMQMQMQMQVQNRRRAQGSRQA